MNAVLTHTTAREQSQHYDTIRRRNAESAYDRNVKYNGENQKIVKNLEALLLGRKEPETAPLERRAQPEQFGAGQVKQITLPIGKTLEEAIDIWRSVRTEAIFIPEPSTADYQLAATASAKTMRMEAKIALHNHAKAINEAGTVKEASVKLPFNVLRELPQVQKRYEKAISTYTYQIQMKQNGFEIGWPDYYESA
ncbi:hypothetical protein [Sporosarcina limicola]|uniref:Uncharacterized protein n=1 Tax=Sporosarcina limicola TaxID=34101 RepID=A0A927MGY4_9BACL|nr:hypothetical protein [Sporosarcina limicola]MBE1552952.1 hypothetical protein [Sporosarcina limicola]